MDFSNENFAPSSISVLNQVGLRMGSNDHILAQLRIEFEESGKRKSLQTGSIDPGETKALFYDPSNLKHSKIVIEINKVTTWVSTEWETLFSEELMPNGCTYALYGTPEDVHVRKITK